MSIMLTYKQERFCLEYLKDHNAMQAALRAGYTEESARVIPSGMLKNPKIIAKIAEIEGDLAEKEGVTITKIFAELARIAFMDIRKIRSIEQRPCLGCWPASFVETIPNALCETCHGAGIRQMIVADFRNLSPAEARMVKKVKIDKDGNFEIETRDQHEALMVLAKITGLLVDRKELSGPGGGPLQVQPVAALESMSLDELREIVANGARGALSDGSLGVDSGVLEGDSKATPIESE